MKRSILYILIIFSVAAHAENPNRWHMFWEAHTNFKRVPGAEDYALQITTNQYALDDLSQELSRSITERRRKEILQEINDRKNAVALLEEQIKAMEQTQPSGK